jgi:hypothetical protein
MEIIHKYFFQTSCYPVRTQHCNKVAKASLIFAYSKHEKMVNIVLSRRIEPDFEYNLDRVIIFTYCKVGKME